jgi:hypothetical protein
MTHVTIEYVIMLPILILQIFLFPLAAGLIMNIWVDSRQTLALEETMSHLGSTIQQLYFSLNHETISAGKATYSPGLPPLIEDYLYSGNGTLHTVTQAGNSTKILNLQFRLLRTSIVVTSSVVLGPNAGWKPSTFMSNSTHAVISANKMVNGTIVMWFGE